MPTLPKTLTLVPRSWDMKQLTDGLNAYGTSSWLVPPKVCIRVVVGRVVPMKAAWSNCWKWLLGSYPYYLYTGYIMVHLKESAQISKSGICKPREIITDFHNWGFRYFILVNPVKLGKHRLKICMKTAGGWVNYGSITIYMSRGFVFLFPPRAHLVSRRDRSLMHWTESWQR